MLFRSRFLPAAAAAGAIVAAALAPSSALAEPVVAISGVNTPAALTFFDTERPLEQTKRTLTGIPTTEFVRDLDVRPATGVIYVVTTEDADNNGGLPDTARLYSVNAATGAATAVGVPFTTTLTDGASLAADFDPVADRLRVVASTGENFRLDPTNGAVTPDTAVTGTPAVASIAYDRSVAGATATTLYAIDSTDDTLVTIGGANGTPSPNDGVALAVGALGYDAGAADGFDISSVTNTAYVLGGDPQTELRSVNLTTGATTRVTALDQFTYGLAVLAPSTIAFATATQNAEERTGRVVVNVVRTGSTQVAGSVDFATADGTAKAGEDYTATSGTLRFAPGETTKTIVVPLTDDGTGDDKETFTIVLTNVAGASLGTATTTLTTVETTTGDRTAPGLVISDLGLKAYRYFSQYGLKTTYSCSEACKSVYTIRLGTSSYLARGTGELRKTGVGVANAPITMLGKARLNAAFRNTKANMIRAQFTITVTDANGNKRTGKRYFFILR